MNTTNYSKAHVEASPILPTISVTRDFAGSVEQLMRAHTDPELFVRWIGPGKTGQTTVDYWDARRGGSWRYVYDADGDQHGFFGSFHDVGTDRIVQTFTWEPMPEFVSLEKLWFEPLSDGQTRLHALSLMESLQARDGMLASGMEGGMEAGYRKLDDLLEQE